MYDRELSGFTYTLLVSCNLKISELNLAEIWRVILSTLYIGCSVEFIDPRVGRTMDVHSTLIFVVCHSDRSLVHDKFGPRADVVYPSRTWYSSPTSSGHCSLHNLFFQAILLFSHDSFSAFTNSSHGPRTYTHIISSSLVITTVDDRHDEIVARKKTSRYGLSPRRL